MRSISTNWSSSAKQKLSRASLVYMVIFLANSGCQVEHLSPKPTIASSKIIQADIDAGYFLAARHASYQNDVGASATFYLAALEQDERSPLLLKQSFLTQYRDGNIDLAAALARQLESANIYAPYAVEPAIAQAIKAPDWDAVIVLTDQLAEDVTATPLASVIKSWALVATGQGDAGLAHLAKSGQILAHDKNTVPNHIQVQLALMAEYLGYKDEGVAIATKLTNMGGLTAKTALQTAGILMRGNRKKAAKVLLNNLPHSFNMIDNGYADLLPPEDLISLIANAIIDAALAYNEPKFISMVPARIQLALYLDDTNDAAWFFLAQSWFELGRFDRAKATLTYIDNTSLWALPGLLLQNDIDIRTDNIDAAINQFYDYVAQHPENAYLYKKLGDLYRRQKKYEKARDNYLQAMAQGFDSANLYRNLAISHERLNEDPEAEANFKTALQRNPNDPFTLNYLGYWWAESGRNLSQAIHLIEQAVRLQPNSGFFVDSLGWVHYQLGNYQLAVEFLEKATTLEPDDALIISHLGDAYWQTKRYAEARFKWRYASQVTDNDILHADLQSKLKSGLSLMGQ